MASQLYLEATRHNRASLKTRNCDDEFFRVVVIKKRVLFCLKFTFSFFENSPQNKSKKENEDIPIKFGHWMRLKIYHYVQWWFCLWNHQRQNRPLKEKSISLLRFAGLLLPPNCTVYAPLKHILCFGKCTKKYPFQIWRSCSFSGIHFFVSWQCMFSLLENGVFSNGSILPVPPFLVDLLWKAKKTWNQVTTSCGFGLVVWVFLVIVYFDQRKPKKNDQLGNNKFIFGKKLGKKKRPGRDAEYPMLFRCL